MAARRRRVLIDFGGSPAEAKRAVRETRDELRRLGREKVEARIDVNERVVLAKIEKVKERLANLSKQEATPKVDLKTAAAYAQLDRLNLRLDRLRLKRVSIDVDIKRGALERTASTLGSVERGVEGVGRGFANVFHQVPILGGLLESVIGGALTLFSNLGEAVGGLVTSGLGSLARMLGSTGALAGPIGAVVGQVVSLGLSLVSLAAVAGGFIIALNALLGAIVALAGALVALVASAAAAAAGLGALAIAFGAALIPVAIVGIAIFTRFQAVLKAHQAQQQALTQATQDHKTAEQARKTAVDESRRAHEQLTQATVDGNRAMAQSAVDLRDAELGLASSQLGVKEARLGLREAQRALREFRNQKGLGGGSLDPLFKRATDVTSDPAQQRAAIGQIRGQAQGKADPLELQQRILAVQRAQLGVKEAINQTAHAEQTLANATKTRAEFVKRGVEAYRPYRQALEGVRRADERLTQANQKTSAAQRKYEQATKGLSTAEQGALGRVNSLVDGFTRFAKILTDPIFRAAGAVFDQLKGHAGEFESGLKLVGEAIGDVVRSLGAFLTEPATLSAFQTLSRGAADLVRQLGARAFTSFLRIMREIALAALPAVRHAAHDVANALEGVAGEPGKIHSATRTVVDQFKTWARLAGSLLGLVKDIFVPASKQGASLADSMRHVVDHWRDWIRANPEKVREFFRDAANNVRKIVVWLGHAAVWLKNHLPAAAATAKKALQPVAGVAKTIYNWIKAASDLLNGDFKKGLKDVNPQPTKNVKSGKAFKPPPPGLETPLGVPLFLKHLLFGQSGGLVPGSGSGDHIPAMLEPGEFILRRAVVRQLRVPVLHALNGGAVPQLATAVPSTGGDVHHHTWNIPRPLDETRYPDPNNLMALIQQAWERGGGGLS